MNQIGTCVLKYIQEKAQQSQQDIEFIFFTDNCAKNKSMFPLYQYAIANFSNVKRISHKFLIRGHTQNEGESAHSTIEREINCRLKNDPRSFQRMHLFIAKEG